MKKFTFLILGLFCIATVYAQQLSVIMMHTDETCPGYYDGSVTAIASGGDSSQYYYNWNNGSSAAQQNYIGPGTYTVMVSDALGMSVFDTVVVSTLSPPMLVQVSSNDISCFGLCDGSISVLTVGGIPPFEYYWDYPLYIYGDSLSGLCANSYSVSVYDSIGCYSSGFTSISESLELSVIMYSNNALGCGATDGSASMEPTGGTSPYYYQWDANAGSVTTFEVLNLGAGSYSVTLTDANGCSADGTALVSDFLNPPWGTVFKDATCFGSNDGKVGVDIYGAILPITYSWSTGVTNTLNAESDTLDSISAGTYYVSIQDEVGCSGIVSIIVNEPDEIQSGLYVENYCFEATGGYASVYPIGGTGNLGYQWFNASPDSYINNVPAGDYWIKISDLTNGCYIIDSFSIAQGSEFTMTVEMSNVCDVSGGTMILVPSGGVSPYYYYINGGVGGYALETQGNDTDSIFTHLIAGEYYPYIADSYGCEAYPQGNGMIMIYENTTPLVAGITSVIDMSCFGICDGKATMQTSGGSAPYTYEWNDAPAQTTSTASNLCTGQYNVKVTDTIGCEAFDSVVLTQPDSLILDALTSNINCFGDSTGTIFLSISDGGTYPFTYTWNNGLTTNYIAGLTAGSYIATVYDAQGCQYASNTFTLTQPVSGMSAAIISTPATCFGDADGQIALNVSGGTIGYTYEWNNGLQTASITGLTAGAYSSTITDSQGCVLKKNNIIVSQPGALFANLLSVINANCGNQNGEITIDSISGGTAAYSLEWSNGSGSTIFPYTISGLSNGNYTLTVTDANGCANSQTVSVGLDGNIDPTMNLSQILCNGGTASASATITNGTGPILYSWLNNSGSLIMSNTSGAINNLSSGNYSVNVSDSIGCTGQSSFAIYAEPDAITSFLQPSTPSTCGFQNGSITLDSITGGTPAYNLLWSDGTSGTSTPVTLSGLSYGNYSVTITDANGCTTSSSILVNLTGTGSVTVSATQITCFGGLGSAIVYMPGGTAPFSYTLMDSTGGIVMMNTTGQMNYLQSGIYTIIGQDVYGCEGSASFTINPAPSQLFSYITSTNSGCTVCNGSASATASGGTLPYYYAWSNAGGTSSTISGLCGGQTYYVTISDANNCAISSGTMVSSDQLPNLSGTVVYNNDFFSANDLTIELYTQTSGTDIELELAESMQNQTGGAFQFSALNPGNYFMRIKVDDEAAHPKIITTYYANTFSWNLATPIVLTCNSNQNLSVNMYEVIPDPSGYGSISGIITFQQIGKKSIMGEPVPGAEIYLEQEPNDEPLFNTESDLGGSYRIDDIPEGDGYSLVVDIPGYPLLSTYSNITISENDSVLEDLNFYVDSSTTGGIYIDSATSVTEFSTDEFHILLYPNPFTESFTIEYSIEKDALVNIELYDASGRTIATFENGPKKQGSYLVQYNEAGNEIVPGFYFVKFSAGNSIYLKKIMKP